MTGFTQGLVTFAIIIASIVLHEISHAATAFALGDPTAKNAGRLTLNPVPHMDLVGSIILPLSSVFLFGSFFGYAKPVPINPFRLKFKERGFALVAVAGPLSNIAIAIICLVASRTSFGVDLPKVQGGFSLLELAAFINVFLAAFNLLPIPPLDGSRIIRPFVGPKGVSVLDRIEPYGFAILLFLVVFLDEAFRRIITFVVTQIFALFALVGLYP